MEDKVSVAIRNTVDALGERKADYVGMKSLVRDAVELLHIGMFPGYIGQDFGMCKSCSTTSSCSSGPAAERRTEAFERAATCLIKSLNYVMPYREACDRTAELIGRIPTVCAMLETDVMAAYQGDPAAKSPDEIILAYPAFRAIGIYRIAHELYLMGVPSVPRMMTEYAHELTGIDIHPGATIGESFFIDHGTGVVIGETTTIGKHVKLYQHVTLGAKSFEVAEDGSLVKGIKRHPDIGDNVVIYAGATILGGNTRVGNNCVIGGNVWLTHSLEPGETVTISVSDR